MAITVANDAVIGVVPSSPKRTIRMKLTGDATYAAGGYTLGLGARAGFKDLGTGVKPNTITFEGCTVFTLAAAYDRANDKIYIVDYSTGAEAADNLGGINGAIFYFQVTFE